MVSPRCVCEYSMTRATRRERDTRMPVSKSPSTVKGRSDMELSRCKKCMVASKPLACVRESASETKGSSSERLYFAAGTALPRKDSMLRNCRSCMMGNSRILPENWMVTTRFPSSRARQTCGTKGAIMTISTAENGSSRVPMMCFPSECSTRFTSYSAWQWMG